MADDMNVPATPPPSTEPPKPDNWTNYTNLTLLPLSNPGQEGKTFASNPSEIIADLKAKGAPDSVINQFTSSLNQGYLSAVATPEAAQVANKATENTAAIYNKGGRDAFNLAVQQGKIPAGSVYVPPEGNDPTQWGYMTKDQVQSYINDLVNKGAIVNVTKDISLDNPNLIPLLHNLDKSFDAEYKSAQAAVEPFTTGNSIDIGAALDSGKVTAGQLKTLGISQDKIEEAQSRQASFKANNTKLPDGQFVSNSDLAELKDKDPEGYRILTDKGFDAYQKYVADFNAQIAEGKTQTQVTVGETPSTGQKYENEAELRAYGQELATTNPALFKVFKASFDSGNWGAFDQAVQTYNDQIEVENKQFKASHTQLGDGQWLANKDLADIKTQSPALYNDVLAKGYDSTLGRMEKLKTENPNLYVFMLQKYDLAPKDTQYFDTLPDGTVRIVDRTKPDLGPSTVGGLAKKIGGELADAFVPGVWARNLKIERQPDGSFTSNMQAWEIGLNAGLDLAVLVPGVGWAAKGVGKEILKAGTSTIEKSLTKNLAKDLAKAGEKDLAAEAVRVGKIAPEINTAAVKLENASRKAAEATFYRDMPKMAKAYKAEAAAKTELVNKMQTFGNDLAELNAKVGTTSVKGVGKEALSKTVGMTAQAPDFAEYIAGSAKDLRTAELSSRYFGKVTPASGAKVADNVKTTIKEYTELPKTIKEVATASKIAVTKGKPEAAAFLRGEAGTIAKAKTPTEIAAMGKTQADKYLSNLQKQLAKESTLSQARAEKYLGKQTALDKWDRFIKDNWNPKTGVSRDITKPLPHSFGGGGASVATISTAGMTAEQAARLGLSPKQAESFVLKGVGGKALFTVITEPDGTTRIVRAAEPIKTSPKTISKPTVKPIKPGVKPTTKTPAKPHIIPVTKPTTIPIIHPGKITPGEPAKIPGKSPVKLPSPFISPKPSISPGKVPEKAPSKAPVKAPAKAPAKMTTITAAKVPAKVPTPLPTPKPGKVPFKTPAKAPFKVPLKVKIKVPVRLPPFKNLTDSEKRQAIKKAGGAFYWQQGKLFGKKVYHVGVVSGGKVVTTTVLGKPPEGAINTQGTGQAKRTIRVTRGNAPNQPVKLEGGAIDVVVTPTKTQRGVTIDFVRDPRYRGKPTRLPSFASRKRGKIIETRIGGRTVLSRRSLRRRR